MTEPMKVLTLGDTHGSFLWYDRTVVPFAADNNCRTIFQVGDFGYFERDPHGAAFLNNLSRLLVEAKIRVVFLLGNHEDWEEINKYLGLDVTTSPEGFKKIRENIWWAPCGLQWKWKNTSFGAVGGAFSIDRGVRTLGKTWFLEEVITDEKAADIIDTTEPESVDIMFAHDVGAYVDMMHHMYRIQGRRILNIDPSFQSRRQLQKIINHWQPHTFIHGHWHLYYQDRVDDIDYYGLNCDYTGGEAFAILTIYDDEASITLPASLFSKRIPIRASGEASASENRTYNSK